MGAVLAVARRCGDATSPDIRALGHVVGRILELELELAAFRFPHLLKQHWREAYELTPSTSRQPRPPAPSLSCGSGADPGKYYGGGGTFCCGASMVVYIQGFCKESTLLL